LVLNAPHVVRRKLESGSLASFWQHGTGMPGNVIEAALPPSFLAEALTARCVAHLCPAPSPGSHTALPGEVTTPNAEKTFMKWLGLYGRTDIVRNVTATADRARSSVARRGGRRQAGTLYWRGRKGLCALVEEPPLPTCWLVYDEPTTP
jgi:hypothetical protein